MQLQLQKQPVCGSSRLTLPIRAVFVLCFVFVRCHPGDITISLFLNECPKTIENFVTLCRDGYYNNLIFHRVIPGQPRMLSCASVLPVFTHSY